MRFNYNHKQRFNDLGMSVSSLIVKMADGNPGAATVMARLATEGPKIDPDAAYGPFSAILGLDCDGIYGPDIWILYKDICGESLTRMVAVLRAVQLGFTTNVEKKDVDGLLDQVQKRLPRFGHSQEKTSNAS